MITTVHRYLGISLVVALIVLAVVGAGARLLRRERLGRPFWGLLYYTETVLVVQIAAGVVLLLVGRRIPTEGLRWLHYLYGSVFPVIALVGGRLYALRRENYDYVPIAFGAFVAFGLTARALMTGDPTLLP